MKQSKRSLKIKDGVWDEGGVWRYRFMHKGKRHFVANPLWKNRTEAKAARDKHRTAVREGRADDGATNTNFRRFVEETFLPWAETNLSPDTHYSYKWRSADLCKAFGKLDLGQVSAFGVEKFKREQLKRKTKRGAEQSAASVNRYLIVLGSILSRAEVLGLISADKRPKIEHLKESNTRIRYLTVAEESALREVSGERFPYLADIICVACSTGLRRDELFSLRKADVDLRLNLVHVMDGKGGKARTVPLDPNGETRAILAARLASVSGEYVFPSPYGGSKLTGVDRSLLAMCRKAGVEPVTLHTLRHTFCTRLAAAGVDVRTIKELAGHSDIKTTMRYMHLVESNVHDAIRKLSGFCDGAEIVPIRKVG